MEAVKTLLRLFSYLFHGLLALLLIALSAFALISGAPNLQMGVLPWTGSTLDEIVLIGSIIGLVTVLLALRSKLRFLFFLWSLTVVVMLLRGYIFTGYHFQPGAVSLAIYLTLASLIALVGGWLQMFGRSRRPARY